mmetsp:Transcript_4299/g.10753  ORF Transcript_4299/g.10753 Transcript_4299/m.10753 type:complete len:81 (-) Transcript_4299:2616-2858(-)
MGKKTTKRMYAMYSVQVPAFPLEYFNDNSLIKPPPNETRLYDLTHSFGEAILEVVNETSSDSAPERNVAIVTTRRNPIHA